jgi:hypothetical protein
MGWIANLCVLYGAWQIGHRRRYGFLFTICGCIIWASIGVTLCRADMVFIESVMGCVALRNFWLWRKQ